MSLPPELTALAEALDGQYAIEREIGRGGMGIVCLARDLKLHRPVAIKTLPRHLAGSAEVRERFLREARTAAHLSHPGIVPIHRADEIAGQVFFVMGYVDGESLAQRIQDEGMPPVAETVRQLHDVALALGYAHARGVVHRDIKAENILIDRATGRAVVTDFGIARLAESKPLTATGQVLGTVHYMSPEQVTGEAVDGRADVYALGVVAFLALSGHFPFDSETPSAILVSHVTKPAPRVLDVAPATPPAIAAIVDRCLAKDREERFSTCGELAAALEAVRADAERADRERANAASQRVSETQARAVWQRAAELQAHTGTTAPPPPHPVGARDPQLLSRSSSYRLDDVRASAAEAGIAERFVERALEEHGLAPGAVGRPPSASAPPRRAVVRTPAAGEGVVVRPAGDQPRNPFYGRPTRLVYEAVVPGEMSERDYDLLVEVLRRSVGEVGQIGSVGRSFAWTVSNQSRKLQVSISPRAGRTTVHVDEQLSHVAGGMFGGIMGGVGGGAGGAAFGSMMAQGIEPMLALAGWFGVIGAAYGAARVGLSLMVRQRERQLRELTQRLADTIAEAIAEQNDERASGPGMEGAPKITSGR